MARLRIGSGIQVEAQLPKIEQSSPKIGPSVVEKEAPDIDMIDMLKKAVSLTPQPEVAKEVDLTPIMSRLDAIEEVNQLNLSNVDYSLARLDQQVLALFNKLEEKPLEKETVIEQPVVQQVTHVRDVSLEVLDQCKEMVRHAEVNSMIKIQDLQAKVNTQKKINIVLGSVLVITILLHLL